MKYAMILSGLLMLGSDPSCVNSSDPPRSSSGVEKTTVHITTGADGLTAEQRNIKERYLRDNEPGAIKHLYVISAYSGQVLIYSTVKGKVTSGGKRLTPSSVNGGYASSYGWYGGFPVNIGGHESSTNEVLQDDGTYGSSMDYLYWFDSTGKYHQQYTSGGCIIHISDQPISIKNVVINMEMTGKAEDIQQVAPLPHPTGVK